MSSWLLLSALFACTEEPEGCTESSKILAYADEDRDGYGDPAAQQFVCELSEVLASVSGDCDDTRSNVNPVALEECDGLDNDCDTEVDESLRELTYYYDQDADGFGDPNNTAVACTPPPGFVENPFDCWDEDELSNPAAVEFCDGKDNDCDTLVDDADTSTDLATMPTWYFDGDGDSYGDPEKFLQQCSAPALSVTNPDDYDDSTAAVSPDAIEVCNGIDDDCDQQFDDSDADLDPASLNTFYADYDQDLYGDADITTQACDAPWFFVVNDDDCDDAEPLLQDSSTGYWVLDNDGDGFGSDSAPAAGPSCTSPSPKHVLEYYATDCDDADADNYPDATEVCDGGDNDCDDRIDDADPSVDLTTAGTYFTDSDSDGYGDPELTIESCAVPPGASINSDDCDDGRAAISPVGLEICNGLDDDCDGLEDAADPTLDLTSLVEWYFDYDQDGLGDPTVAITACTAPAGYVANADDCDDNQFGSGSPSAWVRDVDGDGYGAGAPSAPACAPPAPSGWVEEDLGLDCNDNAVGVNPGAVEVCEDGIDQDCVGGDDICETPLPDTCVEATAEPDYTTGDYAFYGDLSVKANDISFADANACTGRVTNGGDLMIPVTLQANEALDMWFSGAFDATMYLVPTCTAPLASSCNAGAEAALAGGTENLWYQNNSGLVQSLYLVLDCVGACGDFDAVMSIAPVVGAFQPDTCAEAQAEAPMITGGYTILGKNTTVMQNNINDASVCTGSSTPGRESFVPAELLPGETITVTYTQLTADASMYLTTDCNNVATCVVGADVGAAAATESLVYTNLGGVTETLYLALDCGTATCTDYEVEVTID